MKLVRFETGRRRVAWGWMNAGGDTIFEPLGALAAQPMEQMLGDGAASLIARLEASDRMTHAAESVRLLAPIVNPSKIIAVGRNYREHAAESGSEVPDAPLLFGVFPSAIIGPFEDIEIPDASEKVDWEGELAVVIGRQARNVARADVEKHIFGYTMLNDISARDIQRKDGQWTRAKSFDTFKPVGPCITTVDELGLARDLRISVKVSGKQKQNASTALMVFPVDELVEYISAFCTLMPGDIIATGTPSGVGNGEKPPSFLKPGDILETEIEGVGKMVNRMIAPSVRASLKTKEAANA